MKDGTRNEMITTLLDWAHTNGLDLDKFSIRVAEWTAAETRIELDLDHDKLEDEAELRNIKKAIGPMKAYGNYTKYLETIQPCHISEGLTVKLTYWGGLKCTRHKTGTKVVHKPAIEAKAAAFVEEDVFETNCEAMGFDDN